jgi:hypothetical protein
MKEVLVKKKIGDLEIDPKLTELRHINMVFVSTYRQNYRSGAHFPPLVIQKGTNRVVSGNHRLTAMLMEFDVNHEIDVIEKKYKNEREVLEDFVRENATHGNALDQFSKKKLINALLKESCPVEEISRLFNIPVSRIEKLGDEVVTVNIGGVSEDRPAKAGFVPGRIISVDEYMEHEKRDRGLSIGQQVEQLIRWLNKGLIVKNKQNIKILSSLKEAIDEFLDAAKEKVPDHEFECVE